MAMREERLCEGFWRVVFEMCWHAELSQEYVLKQAIKAISCEKTAFSHARVKAATTMCHKDIVVPA
jgi:hypothetical protein